MQAILLPRQLALLLAGYACIGLAYLLAAPPSYGVDEKAHYIRAIAVGRGDLLGQALQPSEPLPLTADNETADRYTRLTTRSFLMPAGLAAPAVWTCEIVQYQLPATCLTGAKPPTGLVRQATYEAQIEPLGYIIPGLAMRMAADPGSALILGRLASMSICLILIGVAARLLWNGHVSSLIGLVAAISPMVVFSLSILNPSGAEISAGILLAGAVIRLSRVPSDGRLWLLFGAGAAVLILLRQLGFVWVAADLGLLLAICGWRRLRDSARTQPRAAATGALMIVAALVGLAFWQRVEVPGGFYDASQLTSWLPISVFFVPEILTESFGVFGFNGEAMPGFAYAIGVLLLAVLYLAATRVANRRQRQTINALLISCGLLSVLISDAVLLPTGFHLQARHMLPFLVIFPIYAAEVLITRATGLSSAVYLRIISLLAVGCIGLLGIGWWTIAHRVAVGLGGPVLFWSGYRWQPAVGWLLPTGLMAIGAMLLLLALSNSGRSFEPQSAPSGDLTLVGSEPQWLLGG